MSFHSVDGLFFLGCRQARDGGLQVVYDENGGHRMIFDLGAPAGQSDRVTPALRAALRERNVIAGLYREMAARKITIEPAS
ncbi:hypothetical protein M8745_16815 [Lutimaribacter sp. EGI FJ00014]|uniref:Uncharacterized protein n=1 Tax=Lutimaribacter degradans TaxID=2945989 RepID=A0ACC6A026_9RHOB|nr:hypothetical protein [Lutimaribacter sp. EGI FJ00013]MCM2563785.1 hypothetical protein [Lutimaribacter sp. EGI FJ00013]MCO0637636.1 hypothetical protein [Lutimaribacter sp. EGI FJ00014]